MPVIDERVIRAFDGLGGEIIAINGIDQVTFSVASPSGKTARILLSIGDAAKFAQTVIAMCRSMDDNAGGR